AQSGKDRRPTNPSMQAKAIESLLDDVILAIGGFAPEAPAAWGAGKLAGVHRQTIEDRQLGIMRDKVHQTLPQPLFDPPEIGGLADGGCAGHPPPTPYPIGTIHPQR